VSDEKNTEELTEYPSGIQEHHGPKVHLFLKLTYIGFVLFAIIYLILYFSGDGSALVEQFNKLTGN
jgi:hypothetical protein